MWNWRINLSSNSIWKGRDTGIHVLCGTNERHEWWRSRDIAIRLVDRNEIFSSNRARKFDFIKIALSEMNLRTNETFSSSRYAARITRRRERYNRATSRELLSRGDKEIPLGVRRTVPAVFSTEILLCFREEFLARAEGRTTGSEEGEGGDDGMKKE